MLDTTLIVLCAGNSTRFALEPKKQWIRCGDIPLWLDVTKRLISYQKFEKIIIVAHQDELKYMQNFTDEVVFVAGGEERQHSLANGLQKVTSKYVMVTDVARCCIPQKVIVDLLENRDKADCIVPYLPSSDTVVYENETINRDDVKLIQTPQLSNTLKLQEAISQERIFTDDSSAIKNIGGSVFYVQGSSKSIKLTFGEELGKVSCLSAPSKDFFVGTGLDIHPFVNGKKMFLGGVEIKSDFGFKAHSDGDVLIHSIIDALLGACGAGDIGEFFPDTDAKYKGVDSKILLEEIVKFIKNVGYTIVNIDVTIVAQVPKINPYKIEIKKSLAALLGLPLYKVNIKATTGEELGFIGRKEGVMVQSVASVKYYDWRLEK
ncbi:MAG: bifunctional 2-C-methyl-D-erythritol 4-phosphate cytidylyltransferase/2-C-methyl-D-erythritol 2,4-cyclodiphosphate synthase [Arcobacteraceae bacterium]|nr:bifunctional 2-C-methyl-D-erythritol 4-phosphate cytidylyltransferase/2-C-methyl-D-erythritol 2,4-cyclodiphosphate synthase [Arcobacteraceae bacterium]